MYIKSQCFNIGALFMRVRRVFFVAFAVFSLCTFNVAIADGYTCETKLYVSCKQNYYLSAYGSRDNVAGLLAKNGSTSDNLGDSSECYACPTGCTCAGDRASPKCSYKITLADNGGSGGSGAIYYSLGDSKYYKKSDLTSEITSSSGAVSIPTKTNNVFTGYYNGSTLYISKTGFLGSSLTAPTGNLTATASWSACTACSAGTGANCSLSVVNNACTYTTSCKTGYGSLTNSGVYNPSCTCVTSCTAAENKKSTQSCTPNNTVSNAHTTNCPSGSQTCAGLYTGGGCHSASDACTGCSVWGACSTTCTAASCKAGYYLESGACKSCDNGYSSADGMTSGRGYCYKNCAAKTGYTHTSGVDYYSATDTCAYTAHTYTVKYDANGGTGTTANSTHTYDAEKNLTENGYTNGVKRFLGWSTNKSATTATYANKATVKNLTATNSGTVTLYAIWGADCTCSTGTGIASCTATAPLGVCGIATATAKTGYKNPTCGASNNNGVSSCTATPITFTVKYVRSPDAATGTIPSQHTCNYDQNCTAAANPYAYTGYVFQHWGCAASSGSCASTTYGASESMKNATSVDGATLTLTPKWTEGKWTITYKCGDGATGKPSTETAEGKYNTDYTTAGLGTCAKTGYNATKWMVSGTNDKKNLSTKYNWKYTENKTFTLDWAANTYTVNYSCGEGATGTPPDGISATYDESYVVASNKSCSKKGFKFLNSWKYNNTDYVSGQKTIKNLTTENGATVTLTANYEPSKVGCPAGKMFDHANLECIPCKSGYYCTEWCMKDGQPNCDYDQGIYADIGDKKYSKNFTGCPTKTTSDDGAATITKCYFNGKNKFKDKIGSFTIANIKSYVYVKQ